MVVSFEILVDNVPALDVAHPGAEEHGDVSEFAGLNSATSIFGEKDRDGVVAVFVSLDFISR